MAVFLRVNKNLQPAMVNHAVILKLERPRQKVFWDYKVRSCLKKLKSFNIFEVIKQQQNMYACFIKLVFKSVPHTGTCTLSLCSLDIIRTLITEVNKRKILPIVCPLFKVVTSSVET